jgi:hypothetical protein
MQPFLSPFLLPVRNGANNIVFKKVKGTKGCRYAFRGMYFCVTCFAVGRVEIMHDNALQKVKVNVR